MNIGILGGGQLGLMLALAGFPLGHRFVFLDPKADAPGSRVAPLIHSDWDDTARLDELAAQVDCITFDFENVPVATLEHLARKVPVMPPAQALATTQDRLHEKQLFRQLDIPTPFFATVDSLQDLRAELEKCGYPAVLKTRRMGYDGKGQALIRTADDAEKAWQALGGTPLLLEGFVDFELEASIIAVRARDGHTVFYPLVRNSHRDGILRLSRAPLRAPDLQQKAQATATLVLDALDYTGVLTIEFFVTGDTLVANEIAPRVHNSGHWTIEAARTSQFENHLRALLDLPLGSTEVVGEAAMLNCIGQEPEPAAIAAVPGARLHSYGKAPQPGRKLGHVTVWANDVNSLEHRIKQLLPLVDPDGA